MTRDKFWNKCRDTMLAAPDKWNRKHRCVSVQDLEMNTEYIDVVSFGPFHFSPLYTDNASRIEMIWQSHPKLLDILLRTKKKKMNIFKKYLKFYIKSFQSKQIWNYNFWVFILSGINECISNIRPKVVKVRKMGTDMEAFFFYKIIIAIFEAYENKKIPLEE